MRLASQFCFLLSTFTLIVSAIDCDTYVARVLNANWHFVQRRIQHEAARWKVPWSSAHETDEAAAQRVVAELHASGLNPCPGQQTSGRSDVAHRSANFQLMSAGQHWEYMSDNELRNSSDFIKEEVAEILNPTFDLSVDARLRRIARSRIRVSLACLIGTCRAGAIATPEPLRWRWSGCKAPTDCSATALM
eukprot:5301470-Prymnesium_polylepis.2